MSHPEIISPTHILYSQVQSDERGNFEYIDDLQRAGLTLSALTPVIQHHLEGIFAAGRFSVRGERFAGGRKVIVEVLDAEPDLSDAEVRRSFEISVQDQVERFATTRSNVLQDYIQCTLYNEVRIGAAYWATLSDRRGQGDRVEAKMSLAAFRRTVQVGDQLELVAAPPGHRSLGMTRPIVEVRSADLVLQGPSYLTLPKAAAFACDGERIRIGIGTEREPDAHLLYRWIRSAA